MEVVHRDFKAANIFLNNGMVKIADFGLAKFYKYAFLLYIGKGFMIWISDRLTTCLLRDFCLMFTEKKQMFGHWVLLYTR